MIIEASFSGLSQDGDFWDTDIVLERYWTLDFDQIDELFPLMRSGMIAEILESREFDLTMEDYAVILRTAPPEVADWVDSGEPYNLTLVL